MLLKMTNNPMKMTTTEMIERAATGRTTNRSSRTPIINDATTTITNDSQ